MPGEMKAEYIVGAVVVLALVAGAALIVSRGPSSQNGRNSEGIGTLSMEEKALRYTKAPDIVSPAGFVNTGGLPVTISEFKGDKVVLVDFWTYSCINCQRTFPYLREWYSKYEKDGLVIIGVHTPEFAFEKVLENVEGAVKEFNLKHPIVLDNDYATWRAFKNSYWPRKYLVDIDGYIVYDHIGEGSYDETERAIQAALAERAVRLGSGMPSAGIAEPEGVISVDITQSRSPEVYFGASRNEYLGNGIQGKTGQIAYSVPSSIIANVLYLGGTWILEDEFAKSVEKGAKIVYKYRAQKVYFVARSDTPIRVKITRDGGQNLGDARGVDVDENGWMTVEKSRLYKLVEDVEYDTHVLEIEIEGAGLEVYTFTFG